jgi:1-deoxy-D-xylulose-5-phosphate reductoisomerase
MAIPAERLDLAALGQLTFELPDTSRFPALALAYRAMELGTGATAVLNAADEVAVEAFLNARIGFLEIASIVERVLDDLDRAGALGEPENISDVMHLDFEARQKTKRIIGY